MIRAWVILVAVLVAGCFNSYQTARMLKPGTASVTGAVSHVRFTEDSDSIEVNDVMVRYGASRVAELEVRYTGLEDADGIMVDTKISITPDRLAIQIPIGFTSVVVEDGPGDTFISLSPTLLWSTPAGDNAELTGSGRIVFVGTTDGEHETLLGATVGVRASSDLEAWALQPELGVLISPEEADEGMWLTLGVGVTFGL